MVQNKPLVIGKARVLLVHSVNKLFDFPCDQFFVISSPAQCRTAIFKKIVYAVNK